MADSLDDFFAKKDKKRGKDKSKAAFSAEALVRELEEGAKQVEYPVRKDTKTSTAIELLGLDADDADWRDFEDVEKRDYTGLKVKEMSLQDQNEEEQRRLFSEQSEPVPDSTAWKIKDETPATAESTSSTTMKPADSKAPVSTKSDTTPVSSTSSTDKPQESGKTNQDSSSSTEKSGDKQPSAKKAYVPPAERNLGEVKLLEPVRLSKTKSSGMRQGPIPNLDDKQVFPSLG